LGAFTTEPSTNDHMVSKKGGGGGEKGVFQIRTNHGTLIADTGQGKKNPDLAEGVGAIDLQWFMKFKGLSN